MESADREDARILVLARRFRAAIEACDLRKLPIGFHEFPRGSCGDATLVLAQYLRENGQAEFVYVCGTRDGYSHAWLERDGLIVDITGDQFADNGDPVHVSRRSTWHAQFEIDRESSSDIDLYDQITASGMRAAYDRITRHLPVQSDAPLSAGR